MNYEELYSVLQGLEKELKDKQASGQRYYKNAVKDTESGDIKGLAKDLDSLLAALSEQKRIAESIKQNVESFDVKAYFKDGDFAEQLLESCQEKSIDVKGDYPVYEMFPYRVRIDEETQDIYLDKKRVQCVRPSALAKQVKTGQEKLMKASFNAQSFLNELADAYDLAMMKAKGKKAPESDLYLTDLYKLMVPMARSKKEYDLQSFAFDLARLYARTSEVKTVKDGRMYQLGPCREGKKAVRILDGEGKEEFLSTIRFYKA